MATAKKAAAKTAPAKKAHTARGAAQDRKLVAGEQEYEVTYVAKVTGKTAAEVKAAIEAVGHSRVKVVKALKKSFAAELVAEGALDRTRGRDHRVDELRLVAEPAADDVRLLRDGEGVHAPLRCLHGDGDAVRGLAARRPAIEQKPSDGSRQTRAEPCHNPPHTVSRTMVQAA